MRKGYGFPGICIITLWVSVHEYHLCILPSEKFFCDIALNLCTCSPPTHTHKVLKVMNCRICSGALNKWLAVFQESDSEDSEEERQTEAEKRKQRALTRIAKRKEASEKKLSLDNLRAPVVG